MKENSIRLGPREQQIAELLLQGCDNAEIARQLGFSGVEYLSALFKKKLGVSPRQFRRTVAVR